MLTNHEEKIEEERTVQNNSRRSYVATGFGSSYLLLELTF